MRIRPFFALVTLFALAGSFPAAQVAWVNPSGGSWTAGANWSGGVVPGSDDDVVISLAGGLTISNVAANAKSLTVQADKITLIGQLHTSAAIKADATIVGGVGSNVTVAAGVTLSLSGAVLDGQLHNNGTVFLLSDLGFSGGSLENLPGGVIDLNSNSIGLAFGNGGTITNSGAILKRTSGSSSIGGSGLTLRNIGEIDVEAGILYVAATTINTGVFSAGAGAEISFNPHPNGYNFSGTASYTFNSGTRFLGAGTNLIPATVIGNGFLFSSNLVLTGTLSGTNTISGSLIWTDGTIAGQTSIAANSLLDMTSTSLHGRTLQGILTNFGSATLAGPNFVMGTIHNMAEGLFQIIGDQMPAGAGTIFNAGLFRISDGKTTLSGSIPIDNSGTVEVRNGT
jgi:hypothetical protein